MDLRRIKARGRSQTAKRWITDPFRRIIWQLSLPYFDGTLREVETAIIPVAEAIGETDAQVTTVRDGLNMLRRDFDRTRSDFEASLLIDRTAPLRKDLAAVSYRLASLEDQLADAEHVRASIAEQVAPAVERADVALAKATEAAAYAAAVEQEIRAAVEMFRDSVVRPRRVLIQFACGHEHGRLLDLSLELHAAYCRRHGIDYRPIRGEPPVGRSAHWRKVELLIEAMQSGYDQVIWMDTDCVIVDWSYNLFDASGFGVAVCESYDSPSIERHLNTGVVMLTRSPAVIEFLATWNQMPTGGKWEDQSAFIELMASRPHRDLLTVLPNRFNCLPLHMEARDPVVRAFHGDPERFGKMQEWVSGVRATLAPMLVEPHPSFSHLPAALQPA